MNMLSKSEILNYIINEKASKFGAYYKPMNGEGKSYKTAMNLLKKLK